MPRSANHVPKYAKHKGSGLAVVNIKGKDHYLGPYNSKASKLEYDRLILEWLAAGRPAEDSNGQSANIKDIILQFWKFAKKHYRKDGEPTGTADNYKPALRLLRHYYGNTPATATLQLRQHARRGVWPQGFEGPASKDDAGGK